MRWQEEVTLTTYEMQWAVRYFTHKSIFWSGLQNSPAEHSTPDENNLSRLPDRAGALSYAKRKYSTWFQLAQKSDRTFKIVNNAYKSPL